MTAFSCPLCGSDRYIIVKTIETSYLAARYLKAYRIDVTPFFPEDDVSILRCVECDLQTYNPALPGDEAFYEKLYRRPSFYENEKPEYGYAIEKLSEENPSKLLDVGCGEGKFLKKIRHAYEVRGHERNKRAVEKLKQAGIRLDDAGDQYDFVVCFQVLEHVDNVKGFLDFICRKVADNGCLLITVPNRESKYFREVFDVLDHPPHHMTQWSAKALTHIAKIYQMEIAAVYQEPHRINHYKNLILNRRHNIISDKFAFKKIVESFGILIDKILVPYFIDRVDFPGHTHGIMLRKSG
jgi:2-polyprenyl-3-methyl-5-hydroxy-6-metoxy-1,4-benzoquinol methylase